MNDAYDDDGSGRLYQLLVDALERTRAVPFDAPVTVAEIYQELVPYRAVRTELGFGMNAEYEHALLRLLSGEAGLLRLEPDQAREEIARELQMLSPNVSIYREYAGCDVWVRPPRDVRPHAAAARDTPREARRDPEPERETPRRGTSQPVRETQDVRQAAQPAPQPFARRESQAESQQETQQETQQEPRPVSTPASATAGSPSAAGRGSATHARPGEPVSGPGMAAHASAPAGPAAEPGPRRCGYCDSELPAHRIVRFCPWCGGDQSTRPCAACGESLEPGWSYCTACGAPREDEGGPAHSRA